MHYLLPLQIYLSGSRTENWFIGEHKCYNTREGLYTNSVRCETVDMNDMAKIAGSLEVVQAIFKIATRLQQCYLTDEEIALYKAVAIMQRGEITNIMKFNAVAIRVNKSDRKI